MAFSRKEVPNPDSSGRSKVCFCPAWSQARSSFQAVRRPIRVKKRGEKYFVLQVGTKEQIVSIDRLKPAFGFTDPAPVTHRAPAAAQPLAPRRRIPGALDPEAEEFSPTATRSRLGRVRRPPERLNL